MGRTPQGAGGPGWGVLPMPAARFWAGRDWRTRLRILRERVFLDRDRLAAIYGPSRTPASVMRTSP